MKLSFNIDYRTNWGESVYIFGAIPELGGGDESKALKLELDGTESWSITIEVDDKTPDFAYGYIVKHENGYTKHEWGKPHSFVRARSTAKTYEIYDRWQDQPLDKPYYSSAFTDCILYRASRDKLLTPKSGIVNIRVSAPMVQPDEVVAICGDNDLLGNWDASKAIVMNDANFPEWSVNLETKALQIPFYYKFVILKRDTLDVVAWEGGDNRYFDIIPSQKSAIVVVSGMRFINPLTPWKGAGVAIPVFSVRSNDDFGVGDFYDLFKMVDWASKTGQKALPR